MATNHGRQRSATTRDELMLWLRRTRLNILRQNDEVHPPLKRMSVSGGLRRRPWGPDRAATTCVVKSSRIGATTNCNCDLRPTMCRTRCLLADRAVGVPRTKLDQCRRERGGVGRGCPKRPTEWSVRLSGSRAIDAKRRRAARLNRLRRANAADRKVSTPRRRRAHGDAHQARRRKQAMRAEQHVLPRLA